jgi:hypothetical protein
VKQWDNASTREPHKCWTDYLRIFLIFYFTWEFFQYFFLFFLWEHFYSHWNLNFPLKEFFRLPFIYLREREREMRKSCSQKFNFLRAAEVKEQEAKSWIIHEQSSFSSNFYVSVIFCLHIEMHLKLRSWAVDYAQADDGSGKM